MTAYFEPIAIVGEGCVLPGALDPRALWELVLEGRSALSRADVAFGNGIGGYVSGFDRAFDDTGYRVPAEALRGLDPVFLWTLHAARDALASAGMKIGSEPRGAIILGNLGYPTPGMSAFARDTLLGRAGRDGEVDPRNRFMSGFPAAFVANALGFGAGGFALDAACASSLYAMKLACDRLHDRTLDVVIAGGTNHTAALFLQAGFLALSALSPTGQSRPFHREADGLVPAQGSAVVVLKRLGDAEASSDRILGVIRGIGLSNDGRSRGLLVPSEDGQLRAMRAAYAMSGLTPSDISLIECHATGTQVGDATELRALRTLFDGSRDVPIGSLKSNLGHLVTASGAAGLIKVLHAMRARVRPPTLHVDAPLDELRDGPLRVLREAEPWVSEDRRRAAISNFGFGGNNAHLLVEEWNGSSTRSVAARPPAAAPAPEAVAIVARAVVAGPARSTDEFDAAVLQARSLLSGSPREARTSSFELDASELRFPPADLRETLPQQLLLLRLAPELAPALRGAPPERTALLVGMQVDGEVTRHYLRIDEAAAARSPKLPVTAAATVGCMPNIVANRLNQELDLRAASYTVYAEEASGTVALDLAVRSLAAREIDVAIVGAVDLSCEAVHRAAAMAVLPPDRHAPGDAAVLLALKRLSDARHDGDPVLGILDGSDDEGAASLLFALKEGDPGLSPLLGHAHAASGLLHVAAALSATSHRARPARGGNPTIPWLPVGRTRRATVNVKALGGMVTRTSLRSDDVGPPARRDPAAPCLVVFGGATEGELLAALERREPCAPSMFRVAIVAPNEAAVAERVERAATRLRDGGSTTSGVPDEGITFGAGPLAGEVAFVFTGPAAAYPHMGRELALALPELVDALASKSATVRETIGFVYDDAASFNPSAKDKLFASAYLALLHGELTRGLLGIAPQASIGYCAGETNALFALGAWTDLDGFQQAIDVSGAFSRELAGEHAVLRRAWRSGDHDAVGWATYRALATPAAVRDALRSESRVHLAIINGPNDVIFAGDPAGCERVAAILGPTKARSLGYDMVMHCPEARAFAAEWRAIHHRPTTPVPGVRFYTHATNASYGLTDSAVADALTGQAMTAIDFPAMIERAYGDGVRVFVEHGPHAGCTKWIGEVLGERPHVRVALDRFGRSSWLSALEGVATLIAAGVPMNYGSLAQRLGPLGRASVERPRSGRRSFWLRFEPHSEPAEPVVVSAARRDDDDADGIPADAEVMAPAPRLPAPTQRTAVPPRTNGKSNGAARVEHPPATGTELAPALGMRALTAHHRALAELQTEFLRQQTAAQAAFVNACALSFGLSRGPAPTATRPVPVPVPVPVPAAIVSAPAPRAVVRRTPRGPRFDRVELETLASGRISAVFGPLFEKQDGYTRQVRMPMPPLLLADRVTGIDAEPGSMGVGTLWTETDIAADAWYLHHGRMPAGIFVEAGQADLLLVSWLGIDFENRGERVYRLLGCELESYGELPKIGDALSYEIRIDSHARSGDVRIFSFSSECWVNGELRARVHRGQAGFFTDTELAQSAGILWRAEDVAPIPPRDARLATPAVRCTKSRFTETEITAFVDGHADACFGPGFERAATHTRTPAIQGGRMRLVDEVTHFDPTGGPWRRGTMRARLGIREDHWFFAGHFKDDPCMPGTLLLEGSLQAMAIYLAALGHTLPRDGWRFEIAPNERYLLRCRGQTIPASKELVYEIFVHEITLDPVPTIYADVLGSVDGLKAFHVRRLGLRLVRDWPKDGGHLAPPVATGEGSPAATVGGVAFDERAMLASALGRPSEAFGEAYRVYDGAPAFPRLPGPPYLFMSRIVRADRGRDGTQVGSVAVAEYDVPKDAWYFGENGTRVIPFAVLLEIALQPCGWLAAFVAPTEAVIRNLDGTGTSLREVPSDVGTLTTTATLSTLSTVGSLMIFGFDLTVHAGDALVYRANSVFGFFSPEAVRQQVGLPTDDAARARLAEASDVAIDLRVRPEPFFREGTGLRLPVGARLLMLDRVTGLWVHGGRAALGRIRAEKDIRPANWFFKAHFFQDPVQPGSLGLEAMVQALELLVIHRGLGAGMRAPRFDGMSSDVPMTWKFRGQVAPENELVVVDLEITEMREQESARIVIADASLWVDGKRIYDARGISMRIVSS